MNKSILNTSRIAILVAAATIAGCGGGSDSSSATSTNLSVVTPNQPVDDWQLVWSDEFDGSAIDSRKWTHEVNCDGGGNQELQCYTDSEENSFVSEGTLKIVAKLNDGAAGDQDNDYTSARMTTRYKGDFKYGRIEMRAKLPKGQGTWPAFWMMPTDSVYGNWPKSGEIDIVEAVNLGAARADGTPETNIYGTIHYGAGPGSDFSGAAHTPETNPGDSFNTYALEWQEGEMRWYFNNELYAVQRQSQLRTSSDGTILGLSHRGWYAELYDIVTGNLETDYSSAPFDQNFYMILNLAVGGSWPSSVNEGGVDATMFAGAGQTYEIDYVRVYECGADPETGRGCETVAPGYDVDVEDGGFLVQGRAPSPTLNPGAPDPITIFDDVVDTNWVAWDCCGGSTPALVADDADRGNVYEFQVANGNNGTVFGFITRSLFLDPDPSSPARATPHNALGMIDGGYVTFDLKVTSAPADPASVWKFKIEADEAAGGAWETDLVNYGPAPVVGEWANYRVPLQDIADNGVDLTLLDVIMVFPAWMTGDGAVFRMDNVAIEQDTSGQTFPEFPVSGNADWALWDCCGGSTPGLVTDDVKGQVAEFNVANGNSGTVLGFITRSSDGGNDSPIDVTPIASNGVLSFDLKVQNAPAAGNEGWMLKIESNANQGEFVEVNLNTSNEGENPSENWQTFTFDISDLTSNSSLDPSGIDVIMIFPAWGTGADAVFRVADLKFHVPGSGAAIPPLATLIDAGAVNENWALWDCCGGSTPSFVADADAGGSVVEFAVNNGNSGTVLGLNSRTSDGGTGVSIDASSLLSSGVFRFDLKVVNAPAAGNEAWMLKLESNANQGEFIEVNLNTSNEGVNPSENWQTFSFDVSDLVDSTLDPSAIDVIMIFPAWGTGADAVYRVDNMFFTADTSGASSNGGSDSSDETPDSEEPTPEPIVYSIGEEIISNGSFDDSDSNVWSSGVVTAEGDNNTLVSQVSSAGDPWSVNVSQVLTLDAATNYTLTFRAKATQQRSIIAGIGQNAAPYYSNTEVVALTTEWTEFTLNLSSIDVTTGEVFSGDNSRVLFDLGAEVGDVSLDDVSLVKSSQIVVDGNFDYETTFWNGGQTVVEDGNRVFTADVTSAGDPWSVNLSQVMTLVPAKTYELSFRAKASQDRTMIAGLGLNASPYHSSTQTVQLTTEWQTFTYTLTTVDDTTSSPYGDDNSRVLFDMGADVGTVYIDAVTVTGLSGELLVNRSFDEGITDWNGGNVVTENDNSYFNVNVSSAGDPWSVNLSQVTEIQPSNEYILTFRAKAGVERSMIAGIGLNAAPYYSTTNVVALSTEWETYTYLLSAVDDSSGTPYGDDNSRVLFDMGAEIGEVSIDDVSLIPVSAFNQLLNNFDFAAGIDGWNAGTVISEGSNQFYQADVTSAGDPWSVNLSQVLELEPSQTYVLSFKSKASVEINMIAGIGLNEAPYHSSTSTVSLNTEWKTFTFTFVANDDTTSTPYGGVNSRVLFDMGAEVGVVSIDDVKLFQRR